MAKKKKKKPLKNKPFPLLLRPYREKKKWSQANLAEKLETTDATIARIENGKQNWNQEFLQNAAKVLGCHWFDLLPLEGERLKAREAIRAISAIA